MSTLGIVIVVAGVGGLLCGVYLLGSHDGHTRGLAPVAGAPPTEFEGL